MKKSFNYDGRSFLYFWKNSTSIKIKPLTYTDLLYLNKNKEELINFILNYLEKEDKVQKNAKNIIWKKMITAWLLVIKIISVT